jgi:hypothetical protein
MEILPQNFSSGPHVSFIPLKNPILSLLKNSVRRNQNFFSGKFRFLETKVGFQGKKKIQFIEIEFFMKGKTRNSGGEKNGRRLEEKSSFFPLMNIFSCHLSSNIGLFSTPLTWITLLN